MCLNKVVLVAEDEETDGMLLKRAFSDSGLAHRMIIVRDGRQAVDYLSGAAPYDDRLAHPLPDLFLLDLKMPRMNGFEVLEWLQTRPELKDLDVVVLSSSFSPADRNQAEKLGACAYLIKPHNFREMPRILRELSSRFLGEENGAPCCR